MTAETGLARGHETGSGNRAAARQNDDDIVPLSLFDEANDAPAATPSAGVSDTPAGVGGMRAALDCEGTFGAATLRQLIVEVAKRQPRFAASDVDHDLVNSASPNALSAMFGHLARAGVLVEVGVQRSRRPERRGSLERIWTLADGAR